MDELCIFASAAGAVAFFCLLFACTYDAATRFERVFVALLVLLGIAGAGMCSAEDRICEAASLGQPAPGGVRSVP